MKQSRSLLNSWHKKEAWIMNVSNQQIISNSAFWSNHWPNHNFVPNHNVPVTQCTYIQLIVMTAKPVNPCMAKLYILVYWYIEHSLWCIFWTENLYISLDFIPKGPFHHKSILVTSHYLNKHWPKAWRLMVSINHIELIPCLLIALHPCITK